MNDLQLNQRIAELESLNCKIDETAKVVYVSEEVYSPCQNSVQCDPLIDKYGVILDWGEGVWCASLDHQKSGRAITVTDKLASRAAVKVIVMAHE
ncbi:MAG: hypothetical protein AAF512_07860 [Pseudomonadota bacterium]